MLVVPQDWIYLHTLKAAVYDSLASNQPESTC